MNENIGSVSSNNFEFVIDMNSSDSYRDTFFEGILRLSNASVNEIRLDLLYISDFVYAADRRIPRNSALDSWTRKIQMNIPVLLPDCWNSVKATLQEILDFLTGDKWDFEFSQRDLNIQETKLLEKNTKAENTHVCMFSGGLDSFIGAIDILNSSRNPHPIFVSHYGGGSKGTKSYQELLIHNLCERFESLSTENFVSFYSAALKSLTGEDEPTTRSRSFMFFSHAIALVPEGGCLTIPENGFVSLNVPLYYSRNGSSSTRTTHPHYIKLFGELLSLIGINITINNPYQFSTKGEMITHCSDLVFLEKNIQNTMSCSHPEQGRWSGFSEPIHCGYCVPCTIRRASILASGIQDSTPYRYKNYENKVGKETFNALRISENKYNSSNLLARVQYSGPVGSNIKDYARVYSVGMKEIQQLIYEVEKNEIS
ncbi:Qat anti-phage system QueC-like protein QatC [Enterococcus sp. S86.2]|uniref:Qat anti-phage system QueC-like protein QatC n=1 Tax=Enterococcus sp. S86.2 TaxID=3031299 RepID=UPI0026EABB4A|nr:Qat anti-phage system QueC-like protein QatC [Enterococcus sp. S86.2]